MTIPDRDLLTLFNLPVSTELPEQGNRGSEKEQEVQEVADKAFEQMLPQKTQTGVGGRLWNGFKYMTQTAYRGTAAIVHGTRRVIVQGGATLLTAGSIPDTEKNIRIARYKAKMKELNDPHYVVLYEWMESSLWSIFKPKLFASVSDENRSILLSQEDFIASSLQIVLAKGFANLSQQLNRANKGEENESSLVRLLSFFTQKFNSENKEEGSFSGKLTTLEATYQAARKTVANLVKTHLPQLGFTEQALIKEYIQNTDQKAKKQCKEALKKEFEKNGKDWVCNLFFEQCDLLSERHQELEKIFEEIADKVFIKSFFPNGLLDDLPLPLGFRTVFETCNGEKKIAKLIADYLQDFYDPLIYNPSDELHQDLEQRIGQNVGQMIQAPCALALGLSKHYIEGEPKKVVDLIQSTLAASLPSSLTPAIVHSQASWIAQSIQEILESSNPNFQSLGKFVQGIMQDLVLALTSQGAKFLIADGEKIDQNHLIKVLTDRLVAQISALNPQSEIPKSFWETLGIDLPIPSFLKPSILAFIEKKVEAWRPTFFEAQTALQDMKQIGEASKQQILAYKGGKDLIALVNAMSDWLLQKIVNREEGLMTQLGVDEGKIEDLFEEYFPGIQIRPEFKNWFKNNVDALGGAEDSQSLPLLKQGITALCLVGIEAMIKTNGNSENFLSGLLENFRVAFSKAITDFKATYSSQMPDILKLQTEIKNNQLRMHKLTQQVTERKKKYENYLLHTRLTDVEVRLKKRIKDMMHAQKRYQKAFDSVEKLSQALSDLKEQRDQDRQTNGLVNNAEQQKLTTQIDDTQASFEMAEKELKISRKESELKTKMAFEEESLDPGAPGYARRKELMNEVFDYLAENDELDLLTRSTAQLEKELDTYLSPFQELAKKIMGFIGLDQADHLNLPLFLKNQIQPYIDSFQKQGFARLLFKESLSVFESDQNRAELERISGSPFLGHLAKAVSEDLFKLLPSYVGSYLPIADELLTTLSTLSADTQPTAEQKKAFAEEIAQLASQSKQKEVTHRSLVRAYVKVTGKILTSEAAEKLVQQLRKNKAKEKIKKIAITPEQIIEMVVPHIPGFNAELKGPLIAELQGFIHQSPDRYQHAIDSLQPYLEGLLLKVFIRLAEKNPAQPAQQGQQAKDTLIVITEKLQEAEEKYAAQQKVGQQSPLMVAQELSQTLMQDVLGIDSPHFFDDLAPLQGLVYRFIKNQLEDSLASKISDIQEGVQTLKTVSTAKRPIEQIAHKFSENLADYIVKATVHHLSQKTEGGELQVVDTIAEKVKTEVELAKGKLSVAKVLQGYQEAPQVKAILGKTVKSLLDPQKFLQDPTKLRGLLSELLERLLNGAIGTIGKFEDTHKEQFNQNLMTHLLTAAAEHFKNIGAAKKEAKKVGHTEISHRDFHQVSRTYKKTLDSIQSALAPIDLNEDILDKIRLKLMDLVEQEQSGGEKEKLTLDKVIKMVKDCYYEVHHNHFDIDSQQQEKLQALTLLEIIKEDSLPNLRVSSGYTPAVKAVLKLLFPNGKKDLSFIPKSERAMVWELLNTTLFPMILQKITETILNPDKLNTLVLNTLQTAVDNRRAPIGAPLKNAPPIPPSNQALNQAAGELLDQLLSLVTLPKFLKDQILDSNGQVNPSMKATLGEALMGQLTDRFIQDKLKIVLETLVLKQAFNWDAKPGAKVTEADLKKASRELVSAEISYQIRSQWAQAQAGLDQWITDYFGKIGASVKYALDVVFRFIFFEVIGTILSYAFYPVTLLLKEILYKVIDLDKNREALLGPLTRQPADQPQSDHVVYNEDLMVKFGKALEKALEEATTPAVPPTNTVV